jgi:hypothetical protein
MIKNHDQYEIALRQARKYEEDLQLVHQTNDALLQNPTIRHAYESGIEKMLLDIKSQIARYENEIMLLQGENHG